MVEDPLGALEDTGCSVTETPPVTEAVLTVLLATATMVDPDEDPDVLREESDG